MFLESLVSTSNLPKSWKMYLRRYWPHRQPVLANLTIHTYKLCISILPTFWNRLPVLTKSPTVIGQITIWYWWNYIPRKRIGDFVNTSRRFQNVRNGTFLSKFAITLWGHLLSIVIGQLFISWRFHFVLKNYLYLTILYMKKIASWKLNENLSSAHKQFLQINWKSEEKLLGDLALLQKVKSSI